MLLKNIGNEKLANGEGWLCKITFQPQHHAGKVFLKGAREERREEDKYINKLKRLALHEKIYLLTS